jgi:cytochrome b
MATSSNSTSGTEPAANSAAGGRLVWDLPLRVCHWGLVLAVACSWLSGELGPDWFHWHVRSGSTLLVLVAFRVGWGFVGPRHARFANFLAGPRRVAAHLRGLGERGAGATTGHSPLGGWAVMALLAALAAQATTGLFANDDVFNTGPLYGYVSDGQSDRLTAFHHLTFDVLLVLLGLHVTAVLFYRYWKRIDLLGPMLTGRKPAAQVPAGEEIGAHHVWLALFLAGAAAGALWYVVRSAPVAEMSYF